MSDLYTSTYNPDVLSCLANLSSDEVFTPPDIANKVLDMLPQDLFKSPDTTFLDPGCKSGVFLREIAKRLIAGLEETFPDLQERINHIFHKQLFGIAITEITSLLSRRSLYCSKYPNSIFSVSQFQTIEGNVRFRRTKHTWEDGRCVFCGASRAEHDRGESLETYAYEFIHTESPEEIYHNMKFDVIIGNPPYQLNDGGGTGSSALPIYNKFVEQAKKLNPRYLVMVIPSRWFTGGRGLDTFRDEMLHDDRVRVIHDYPDASDCFPGVEIKGGVCYFKWDRANRGLCKIFTHKGDSIVSSSERSLLEKDMELFIRNNELISILYKIMAKNEALFADIMSANDPFGFDVRVDGSYKRVKPDYSLRKTPGSIEFYYNGWKREGVGHVTRSSVRKGQELIDKYKIFIPKAWGVGNPETDWLNPFIGPPGSCCTETYLAVGPFDSRDICENAISYMQTRFFHAVVSAVKITQNTMKKAYSYVPMQDFSKPWTDEELYKKYELSASEIQFIETAIRPAGTMGGDDDNA